MKEIQPKTIENIEKTLNLLREAPNGIHLRGISSALNLNPFTIWRIIEIYLQPFVETKDIGEFGIRVRLIRLKVGKEQITAADVLRYHLLKEQIRKPK